MRHQQMNCRWSGGPPSKSCSCEHCTHAICTICGAREGGLTTDCPGSKIDFNKQQEIYETPLDYTDARGWHLGEPAKLRSPRFTETRLAPEPPRVDHRVEVAPSIDWAVVDRNAGLQHELAQKAIAWVIADRVAEDHSATLTRLEDEVDALPDGTDTSARRLLATLESAKIEFHLASQRAERCDDEFRQIARRLVTALEEGAVIQQPSQKKIAP